MRLATTKDSTRFQRLTIPQSLKPPRCFSVTYRMLDIKPKGREFYLRGAITKYCSTWLGNSILLAVNDEMMQMDDNYKVIRSKIRII